MLEHFGVEFNSLLVLDKLRCTSSTGIWNSPFRFLKYFLLLQKTQAQSLRSLVPLLSVAK